MATLSHCLTHKPNLCFASRDVELACTSKTFIASFESFKHASSKQTCKQDFIRVTKCFSTLRQNSRNQIQRQKHVNAECFDKRGCLRTRGPVNGGLIRRKGRYVTTMALTGPLVNAEASTALWAILAASAAVGQVLESRTKWGASVSAPLLTMGLSITLSWSGVIPTASPIYETVWSNIMPLAVCLFLLETDVRKVFSDAGATLKAFLIGAVGTVIGTLIAFACVGRWMGIDGWRIASCLCASYIGGTINYAATAQALGLASGGALAAGMAADNLAMAAYFGVLMSWPTDKKDTQTSSHSSSTSAESDSKRGENGGAAAFSEENTFTGKSVNGLIGDSGNGSYEEQRENSHWHASVSPAVAKQTSPEKAATETRLRKQQEYDRPNRVFSADFKTQVRERVAADKKQLTSKFSPDASSDASMTSERKARGSSNGVPLPLQTLEERARASSEESMTSSPKVEEIARASSGASAGVSMTSANEDRARASSESVSLSLAAAACSCYLGQALASVLPPAFQGTELALMAVIASLMSIFVGHVTSKGQKQGPHIAAFAGAETIGGALMQIFFAVVGATASLQEAINGGWPLLVFILLLLAVHVAFITFFGSKVFKLPIRSVLIASNANVGGPATAAAMASAKGWPEQVRGALLTGTLGYTVGTAIGCLVGTFLRSM